MPEPRSLRRAPLLLLAAVTALAGCSTAPTLRDHEPDAGPYTARLLVRRGLQPKDAFGVYLLDNAQLCGEARRIAVGNSDTPPAGALIRAERLSTLSTMIVTPEGRCSSVLSFVPRSGRSYALTVATEEKRCWSYLFDVTDPDKTFPEPSVRRRDTPTSACVPLGASRAPAAAAPPASGPSAPASPSEAPKP